MQSRTQRMRSRIWPLLHTRPRGSNTSILTLTPTLTLSWSKSAFEPSCDSNCPS